MLASLKRALSSSSSLPATSSFVLSSYFFPVFRSTGWKKNRSAYLSLRLSFPLQFPSFSFFHRASNHSVLEKTDTNREREREREIKSISTRKFSYKSSFSPRVGNNTFNDLVAIMDNNPRDDTRRLLSSLLQSSPRDYRVSGIHGLLPPFPPSPLRKPSIFLSSPRNA